MTLPAAVRERVEASLGPVRAARPVGGGSIHAAARLELDGGPLFLKYGEGAALAFAVEARGLEALRAAGSGLRLPEVAAVGGDDDGPAWLALEWLEPGRRDAGFGERLGQGLAALHRAPVDGWGWGEDCFIGSLPQDNRAAAGWADFWWSRRLEPQLRLAGERPGSSAEWERLAALLPSALAAGEEEGPSLLHGDLWSGNVLAVAGGEAGVVDPAVYRGHREVDLAMSELFGGFEPTFHAAYAERWPLLPGYAELRRHLYQLYYLLVHVNLFGGTYHARTAAALRRALAAA